MWERKSNCRLRAPIENRVRDKDLEQRIIACKLYEGEICPITGVQPGSAPFPDEKTRGSKGLPAN